MKAKASAQLNNLRMSPRKVRLVISAVKGMNAKEAALSLSFMNKAAARPVKKLIDSAIANARHNHDMKEESLQIVEAYVNEGKTLRRWMPRAFGRATPLNKRSSRITLVLEGDVVEQEKKEKKTEKKEEKKEEVKVEEKKDEKPAAKKAEKKETKPQAAKKADDAKKDSK